MDSDLFDELKHEILKVIESDACADIQVFNSLAVRIHEFQRGNNAFYQRYCSLLKLKDVEDWHQLPPIPTSAFKRTEVRSFPESETTTYFQTSGTTEVESGRHYFSTLEIYEAAILPNFERNILRDTGRMLMAFLTPTPSEAPHSSLVHMMETVRRRFGDDTSSYFMINGSLDTKRLTNLLCDCKAANRPIFLLGTAFAFVFLLDHLAGNNTSFSLPRGSRIMETGGFKGRTRELERPEFYGELSTAFGIPQSHIVNEYGMTELSSQFYDESLSTGNASAKKTIPSWTRIQAVNPMSGNPVKNGDRGLIRIYDLANLGSVIGLQTEDVGIVHDECHFEVLGRVAAAPPRGCSLGAEDLLTNPPTGER